MPAASHVVMGDCALAPAANVAAASNAAAVRAWRVQYRRTDAIRDENFTVDIFPPFPASVDARPVD
jgi:hypothetical protein